jgi:hypothetical protein
VEGDTRRAELAIQFLYADAGALEDLDIHAGNKGAGLLAYGWWMRCVRTAESIRILHAEGLGHEASPLVRTLLHHEQALLWLAQEPEFALQAVTYQHAVDANKIGSGISKRQWVIPGVDELPKKPKGPVPAGMKYLAKVEDLGEHVGRPNHYIPYRVESAYVHPSVIGGQAYIAEVDGTIHLRIDAGVNPTPLQVTTRTVIHATESLYELVGDARIHEMAEAARERFGPSAMDEEF